MARAVRAVHSSRSPAAASPRARIGARRPSARNYPEDSPRAPKTLRDRSRRSGAGGPAQRNREREIQKALAPQARSGRTSIHVSDTIDLHEDALEKQGPAAARRREQRAGRGGLARPADQFFLGSPRPRVLGA